MFIGEPPVVPFMLNVTVAVPEDRNCAQAVGADSPAPSAISR